MEALVIARSDMTNRNKRPGRNHVSPPGISAHFQQIVRFGTAGIVATLFYFMLVSGLLLLTNIAPVLASTLAYILSLGVSYFLQSRFTFSVVVDTRSQVVKFLLTAIVGLVVSSGGMLGITELLHWPSYAGAAVICVLIPVANYFVFKSWVFVQPDLSLSDDLEQNHE